ncbi:CsbD family protein [Cognatishimia sp. F0-27]|uniref:CsbD family protein n=1 Tax=Cognatishimia sp. F0-27 TaxID=2816855 RepID=UPI001D0C1956|nr:CsbD family protein [Cognatishimia sp. F0-27]MCC1493865.1 CsbD family protein [Cognatishimia sp. F0-27]
MDNDRIEGNWTQIKGRIQEAYGVLTDDEIEQAKGNREQLEGLMQEKLGKSKDEARQALDSVLEKL